MLAFTSTCKAGKGSDWIWLVFAHPLPLNNGAPVASTNFISDGKVQVSKLLTSTVMGAPLYKTNGWAQSSPYPVSPLDLCNKNINVKIM